MVFSKNLNQGIKYVLENRLSGYMDIDDTCVPLSQAMIVELNSQHSMKLQKPIELKDLAFHKWDKIEAFRNIEGLDTQKLLYDMESKNIIENLKPYRYAIEVSKVFSNVRPLPLMTSRERFYKDARKITHLWAEKYLVREGHDAEIIFNAEKCKEAKSRGMGFAFEDHPPTILELLRNDMIVFVHIMPFNRMGRLDSVQLDTAQYTAKKIMIEEIKSYENTRMFYFKDYSTINFMLRGL